MPSYYRLVNPKGSGGFGIVVRAEDTRNGRQVAIKKMLKSFEKTQEMENIVREIKILQQLDHENVIKLIDILNPVQYNRFQSLYLVYELMDGDL